MSTVLQLNCKKFEINKGLSCRERDSGVASREGSDGVEPRRDQRALGAGRKRVGSGK